MPKKPKPHELRERANRVAWKLERTDRPRQILPPRHLFVTEGTKTEPNYLEGLIELIAQRLCPDAKKQFDIKGEGTNTLGLLSAAEGYLQNDSDDYRHVWILYDKDDFPADSFDNTVSRCAALTARNKARSKETEFHAIWSNQCMELWFLLHFIPLDADIPREQYREKLSDHLGKHYEKNDSALFSTLLPHLDSAIKNAKELRGRYQGANYSDMAPCTVVYELVEELMAYIK